MTHFDLNDIILNELHKASTEQRTPAHLLIDILHLSKESAYRRLRNEVKFTLDEAAKLSLALNFSLDFIIGNTTLEKSVFDLNQLAIESDDYYSNIFKKLDDYIDFVKQMQKDPTAKAMFALNSLPYTFYFDYENISRFKYYKWLYLSAASMGDIAYEETLLPDGLFEKQQSYVVEAKRIKQSVYIFDRNVFTSIKYDIEYFHCLGLISDEDVKVLKTELLEMLGRIEATAKNGKFETGHDVAIYISSVDIEASYTHYEHSTDRYSHLRVYGISGVDTHSSTTSKKHKAWIESHKRYSTVISKSGEMQRIQYFNAQRKAIRSIVDTEL